MPVSLHYYCLRQGAAIRRSGGFHGAQPSGFVVAPPAQNVAELRRTPQDAASCCRTPLDAAADGPPGASAAESVIDMPRAVASHQAQLAEVCLVTRQQWVH